MGILLDIVTTMSIGLLIGTEFAVAVFIHPVLKNLDKRAELDAIRLFARRLGKAMPFRYALSLLMLIAESIARRDEGGLGLLIIATFIWSAVIVLAILFPCAHQ